MRQNIKDLTLLLMWLNSWKEKESGVEFTRCWKGYDFEILKELQEKNLISSSFKSKSAVLTEKGIEEVKKLEKKYLGKK